MGPLRKGSVSRPRAARDCVDRMEMILCSDEINYRDRETRPVPKLVLRTEKICRYSPAATLVVASHYHWAGTSETGYTSAAAQPPSCSDTFIFLFLSCLDLKLVLDADDAYVNSLRKVTSPAQKSKQIRSSGESWRAELRLDLLVWF